MIESPTATSAAATVITSDFENHPLVVRESLMLKVPVIASAAGGIPEIIEPEINGLLFPPGDAAALRRQVRRLSVLVGDHDSSPEL